MIKIILRSVFYPFFVLFVGITIGFIANAEWSGRKYIMIEKSINNIFFPVNKYNKNVEEYVRYIGGLKLMSNHDYPKYFIILDDTIIDEEFYTAIVKFTDIETGELIEKREGVRVRWRPWEYYYQEEERSLSEK